MISRIAFFALFLFAAHAVRAQTNATPASPPPALTNAPPSSSATGLAGARQAQNLYRLGRYEASAKAYQEALTGLGVSGTPTLRYNAACALYKAGRFKEAAELFQQLAQQADSSVVKESQYNAGCALLKTSEKASASTNAGEEDRVDLMERAGKSFQQALRTDADFQMARLNLAVLTNALPDAREQAKLSRLMSRYGNTPPPRIAEELLRNQRSISQRWPEAESNTTPARIEAFESLAALQADNTDLLIPLRATIQQAISQTATNPQAAQTQMQEVQRHLDATANTMRESYGQLRDLDENADIPAGRAEKAVYGIWKSIAAFPSLLQEDISQQSNLVSAATAITPTPELVARQTEALELTHVFQDRFTKAIPPEGTAQPQNPTSAAVQPSDHLQSNVATPNVQHPTSNSQPFTVSTQDPKPKTLTPSPSAQPLAPTTHHPQPTTQNP
ncbi:MAG: hypothetical protein HY343_01410, partial [Lentisphaerae bacterium]|nr:hypothetical protein [Lentisphaerota bacterium]